MIMYRHEIREASALTHRRDPHHMAPRLYSRPRLLVEQPGALLKAFAASSILSACEQERLTPD
jgi:hypothetical protein